MSRSRSAEYSERRTPVTDILKDSYAMSTATVTHYTRFGDRFENQFTQFHNK